MGRGFGYKGHSIHHCLFFVGDIFFKLLYVEGGDLFVIVEVILGLIDC